MTKYFLRLEGVNLNNFVYDTQDLSTIRGGSFLLLDAVTDVGNRFRSSGLNPITTGGSSGLFEVEIDGQETAERFRAQVQDYLNTTFKHATFVCDVKAANSEGNFVLDRESLLALNRWHQMQSPTISVPAQNTDTQAGVCETDQVRAAMSLAAIPPNSGERVSESVKTRRDYGRNKKQEFIRNQLTQPISRDFARHLEELTANKSKGNLDHKMAVIFLDGNGFGKLQNEQCTTPEKLREFDTTIKNYRERWLAALIAEMDGGIEQDWISSEGRYRLEILQWGGDEILWVVPAWQGWKTLTLLYSQARDWTFPGDGGTSLTHAGGVVFCHHNAPIHRITGLAHELADLVKDNCRKAGVQGNYFAYEVLESFDHIGRNLEEFRRERYTAQSNTEGGIFSDPLILSGGDIERVIPLTSALEDNLPLRKLHAISRELLSSSPPASDRAKQLIKKTIESLGPDSQTLRQLSPLLGGDRLVWLHLAALWDYLV